MLWCDLQALHAFIDDDLGEELDSRTLLFPTGITWPMGFSRSSPIAQEVSMTICEDAGISINNVISPSAFTIGSNPPGWGAATHVAGMANSRMATSAFKPGEAKKISTTSIKIRCMTD